MVTTILYWRGSNYHQAQPEEDLYPLRLCEYSNNQDAFNTVKTRGENGEGELYNTVHIDCDSEIYLTRVAFDIDGKYLQNYPDLWLMRITLIKDLTSSVRISHYSLSWTITARRIFHLYATRWQERTTSGLLMNLPLPYTVGAGTFWSFGVPSRLARMQMHLAMLFHRRWRLHRKESLECIRAVVYVSPKDAEGKLTVWPEWPQGKNFRNLECWLPH